MDDITRNLSQAYLQVLGLGKEEEAVTDEQVIAEEELDEAKMDPVNKKALKKDFKDREDKDIDNDGDEDESDEYLHNRRKAIAKAVKEEIELDEANFAATMKKAIAAHERGDHKRAKYHLDNAKTARYAMKSTEISKNKEMLDKYEKLRGMHEDIDQFTDEEIVEFMLTDEFEQLDEISQGLLRRYHGAAASDLQKRRQKLNKGTMTTQDHRSGQNRVKGLNRAANKMEEVKLDEANFAATMKKAIAAHERGDHKRAKYHLDNAKTARYAMKSTEISKNKEMLDKYEKLRGMAEEVELDEALDPSEIASNPKMYDAATVKKAYYHKSVSAQDKQYLERHLDRHHGNKEWRKPVKEEVEQVDEISLDKMKAAHKELKGRAYDAHMDDNKYMARKYASRALHVSDKIKKKERELKKEDFDQFTDEEIIEFMLSDEFKQLDEISQGLLRRYHGAAASDLQKRRQKLARGTMTTQDHKAGQRRVAGLNRATNKMEATENEMKYGRNAGMLIDRVQEAKDPKAGAIPPQTYGDNASQNTKDFVDIHKTEISHDAEKANLQNFKDFTAKVKVAKKRPNDNSAGDTKVVK